MQTKINTRIKDSNLIQELEMDGTVVSFSIIQTDAPDFETTIRKLGFERAVDNIKLKPTDPAPFGPYQNTPMSDIPDAWLQGYKYGALMSKHRGDNDPILDFAIRKFPN